MAHKVIAGVSDLATTHPVFSVEWHPTKNGKLTPQEVSAGSNKKVWWLGKCGHEWDAVIAGRTGRGQGCPICSNQRVLAGFNDLATRNPVLSVEWHPTKNGELTPQQVSAGSNKKVWWLGKCGHEWDAILSSRASGNNNGCPICSNQRVLAGFNDLATTKPSLANQWHPTKNGELTPQQITAGSNKNVWWLGKCNHEWEAAPSSRSDRFKRGVKVNGNGCPVCRGLTVVIGFNDLATTNPVLAKEWHPTKNGEFTPQQITDGSIMKVWWLGACTHEWVAAPNDRKGTEKRRGSGCPICRGFRVLAGFNDLATIDPVLAEEWHPTKNEKTAAQVIAGSHTNFWWLGKCGHEWKTTPKNRMKQQSGCPICVGQKLLTGFNDLATTHPALAAEWHPTKNGKLTPQEVSAGSNKKFWWLGECGHDWEAVLASRKVGTGCAACAGQKIIVGFNDLASVNPVLAAQWHPTKNGKLTPQQITSGSTKKSIWWIGNCTHEWEATVDSRARGNGCPVCANRQVLVGFNDLATTNPVIAGEWHPTKNGELTPQQVTGASHVKYWWLGKCGHEWVTRFAHRNNGSGCPVCANRQVLVGFNDLATRNPSLAAEWHPTKNGSLTPEQVTFSTHKRVWWKCVRGHEWEGVVGDRNTGKRCAQCWALTFVSKAEQEIHDYILALDNSIEIRQSERKVLRGKELDIYIPSKQIAIEFNGIYWHTEASGKNRTYHYGKWSAAKKAGIQLIQIWEDDWNLHPDIIMRTLAHKLGLSKTGPVVDTKVIPITEHQAEEFLNENHLQGFASGSHYLGLIEAGDMETLQAVLVLNNEPKSQDKSLEIIRYSSIANESEDFSTLLSYAINAYSPESITVIADHCEANEELYVGKNFIAEKELPPDYMYVIRTERNLRLDYPMERFRDDPKLLWEEGLTEMELADLNGLTRIWDAGKTIYRLSCI